MSISQSGQHARLGTEQGSTLTGETQAPPLTTDGESVPKTKRYINIDMDDPEADILALIAAAKASYPVEQHPKTSQHTYTARAMY